MIERVRDRSVTRAYSGNRWSGRALLKQSRECRRLTKLDIEARPRRARS